MTMGRKRSAWLAMIAVEIVGAAENRSTAAQSRIRRSIHRRSAVGWVARRKITRASPLRTPADASA
jgi:hypothetical protein